ncbi:MAG: uncharacterized protein A8A55_0614 [Amphiamblys sp. WSBS2006]|nr:MAG: uncharacterized protein A8A55_0614 [Amphiamblys sp. WSBS2006]
MGEEEDKNKNESQFYKYLVDAKGIKENIGFSLGLGFLYMVLFFFLQRLVPKLYFFNNEKNKTVPVPVTSEESMSGEKEDTDHLLSYSEISKQGIFCQEKDLLPWIGVEAVTFLRLVWTLFLVFVLKTTVFLSYLLFCVLFEKSGTAEKFFLGTLRQDNKDELFGWFIVVMAHVSVISVIVGMDYVLEHGAKWKLVDLRLPASLCTEEVLEGAREKYRTKENISRSVGVRHRTILAEGKLSFFVEGKVRKYFEGFGCGEIESTEVLFERKSLELLVEYRKMNTIKLEREVCGLLARLKREIRLKERYVSVRIAPDRNIEKSRRKECFWALLQKEFFPKGRRERNGEDAIWHYTNKVLYIHSEILRRIGASARCTHCSNASAAPEVDAELESLAISFSEHSIDGSVEDETKKGDIIGRFFSAGKRLFRESESAFVTFEKRESAEIVLKLVYRREDEPRVIRAPAPGDILWERLSFTAFEQKVRGLSATVMYVLFLFIFTYGVFFVVDEVNRILFVFFSLDEVAGREEQDSVKNYVLRFVINIVGPLVYNNLIALAPICIYHIEYFRWYVDVKAVEDETLRKYSLFLLLQTFFVIFFGFLQKEDSVKEVFSEKSFEALFGIVSSNVNARNSFFFNTLVHKAFCILPGILNKYGSLFLYVCESVLGFHIPRSMFGKAYLLMDYVQSYPLIVLNTLQVIFIYLSTVPLLSLVGCVFFGIAYFVFKHELIYALKTRRESSGKYLETTVHLILYSVFMVPGFSILNLLADKKSEERRSQFFSLVPLFVWMFLKIPEKTKRLAKHGEAVFLSEKMKHEVRTYAEKMKRRRGAAEAWDGELPQIDAVSVDGTRLCAACVSLRKKNIFSLEIDGAEDILSSNFYTAKKNPVSAGLAFLFPRELFEIVSDCIDGSIFPL